MVDAREITRHHDDDPPPGETPWVGGFRPTGTISVVEPDPSWPATFDALAAIITGALGDRVVELDHVGSTAVPDLPAKPVIDIDLTVVDSTNEAAYVPDLERAGFRLIIREPWWHEHRCFTRDAPRCNLHVFSQDCPETIRHRLFRDWLRAHPEDRALYTDAKLRAAEATNAVGEHVENYNERKQAVIRQIYDRAFRAAGLLP